MIKGISSNTGKEMSGLTKSSIKFLPKSEIHVFNSARKQASLHAGRPSISDEVKQPVISFLGRPYISYCKPGRSDTVCS